MNLTELSEKEEERVLVPLSLTLSYTEKEVEDLILLVCGENDPNSSVKVRLGWGPDIIFTMKTFRDFLMGNASLGNLLTSGAVKDHQMKDESFQAFLITLSCPLADLPLRIGRWDSLCKWRFTIGK